MVSARNRSIYRVAFGNFYLLALARMKQKFSFPNIVKAGILEFKPFFFVFKCRTQFPFKLIGIGL
jgi:hypothetical protein